MGARFRAAGVVGVLLLAAGLGCAERPARPSAPGAGAGESRRIFETDPGRVHVEASRATASVEWAVARIDAAGPKAEPRPPVTLRAQLPDGRSAHIRIEARSERRVEAIVRVGQFGDPLAEARWLEAFADHLARPPRPGRHRGFKLSPWPDAAADEAGQ